MSFLIPALFAQHQPCTSSTPVRASRASAQHPLLRFLSEIDQISQPSTLSECRQPSTITRSFLPSFDVKETPTAYELHGDLPGLTRENVSVDFTDERTLKVSGKVERQRHAETESSPTMSAVAQNAGQDSAQSAMDTAEQEASRPQSPSSHHATVEDDVDDYENIEAESETATVKDRQSDRVHEAASEKDNKKPSEAGIVKHISESDSTVRTTSSEKRISKEPSTSRYWVEERSIGTFARTFTFPAHVDRDGVRASLKDGVLSIVVPKATKYAARKILVD